MAPVPAGGHPTLAQYIAWAEQQGCQVSHRRVRNNGRSVCVTKFRAPSGRGVLEVGTELTDYLVPTTVDRLDRRLGLRSPWPSIPHPNPWEKL
jgi:hypothetical protein